jgi:hypothetical protein
VTKGQHSLNVKSGENEKKGNKKHKKSDDNKRKKTISERASNPTKQNYFHCLFSQICEESSLVGQ